MNPFVNASIKDALYLQKGPRFRPIDSTAEVNAVGLRNRLEFEYVNRLLTGSIEKILNDLIPGGKEDVRVIYSNPQRGGATEKIRVYLWDGYVICTSASSYQRSDGRSFSYYPGDDYTGQWVNWEDGVYGKNLLELYIYRTKSHPRDAHRTLARKYGWDLSSKIILFQNPKAGSRPSPTMSDDFDFAQPVEFVKEMGLSIHSVCKYRTRTGALRGAMVYCQSQDKTQLTPIPVVQTERVYPNDREVTYPSWTQVPAANCVNPNLQLQVHGYPPHVLRQAEIAFFQAPYPLYNEPGLETNKEDTVIISEDEIWADRLAGFFEKSGISGYVPMSWPGGKNTVKNVDWWPLEGRKIGYAVHKNDKNACLLAFSVYQALKEASPVEFRFHLHNKNCTALDSIKTGKSFAKDYSNLTPDDFVKYVWERFGISLTGDSQADEPLKAFTVEELMSLNPDPPDYVIDQILPSSGSGEFFGQRGNGKTFFALELARAIAIGEPAFGRLTIPSARPVLYVDGEMAPKAMAKRSKLLGLDQVGDNLMILPASMQNRPIKDLSTPEGQASIEHFLKEKKIEVIILDNLASLAPKSLGNDVECCIPLNNWICDLKRRGYTVIFVHHASKANGGRGGNQRGSSTKEDILDLVISLEKPKQKRNQAHFDVVFSKAREAYGEAIEPFSLMLATSEDSEGNKSAHWEVGEYSYRNVDNPEPKPPGRPQRSQEESQALLSKIESLYRTTSDNEDTIAKTVGLGDRNALNRFLTKYPEDRERIKAIRRPSRSKAEKSPQATAIGPESSPTSSSYPAD